MVVYHPFLLLLLLFIVCLYHAHFVIAFAPHSSPVTLARHRSHASSLIPKLTASTSRLQSQHLSLTDISLDTSVLPKPMLSYVKSPYAILPVLAVIAASSKLDFSSPSFVVSPTISSKVQTYQEWMTSMLPMIQLYLRIKAAKSELMFEKTYDRLLSWIKSDSTQPIDLSEWNICSLQDKEIVSNQYTRYRFSLNHPDERLPLLAGQEILLCATNEDNQVMKSSYHVISKPNARGFFDIMSKHNTNNIINNNNNMKSLRSDESNFINTLDRMNIGDELGFKGGECRLQFLGNTLTSPIQGITLIGSGMGITPSIQILQQILQLEDESTVNNINFLWLNEDKNDFILDREIEKLELKHFEKLTATKISDRNIFGRDIGKNRYIIESTTPYEDGRVAIVCGPRYHTTYITHYLMTQMKYPIQSIAVIDTPN